MISSSYSNLHKEPQFLIKVKWGFYLILCPAKTNYKYICFDCCSNSNLIVVWNISKEYASARQLIICLYLWTAKLGVSHTLNALRPFQFHKSNKIYILVMVGRRTRPMLPSASAIIPNKLVRPQTWRKYIEILLFLKMLSRIGIPVSSNEAKKGR